LARANADHAKRFLAALAAAALTTREQSSWFEHYQKASRAVRERMVEDPRLFLDALRARGTHTWRGGRSCKQPKPSRLRSKPG
jgi:hypothetical protein